MYFELYFYGSQSGEALNNKKKNQSQYLAHSNTFLKKQ